jgi:hypothetical protein
MFRRFTFVFAALLGIASLPALAHEGHDDEEAMTEKQVAQLASKTLPSLVQSKKVGAAWSGAQHEGIAAQTVSGKNVWVVAYKNPDGKVDGGKPLYLVFDDLGNFVEAKHTSSSAVK